MTMRKILIFILCCSILSISCVPVYAAEESLDVNYIDLLTADKYDFVIGTTSSSEVVPGNYSTSTQAVIKWDVPYYEESGVFYFYVETTYSFNIVRATGRGDDLNSVTECTMVGQYDRFYLYRWEGRLNGHIYIRFNSSRAPFTFNIRSLWLTSKESVNVRDYLQFNMHIDPSVPDVGNLRSDGEKTFGGTGSIELWSPDYHLNLLRCDIPLVDLEFKVIDKLTIIFRTNKLYDVSCSLNSLTTYYSVPLPLTQHGFNSSDIYDPYIDVDVSTTWVYYSTTVDLSNIDLSDDTYSLSFNFICESVQYLDRFSSRIELLNCFYNPLIMETPWYKTFFTWLTKPLNSIIELLRGDNVDDENIIFDNAEEMSTQASILDDFNEQLQMVDRPTIDSESLVQDNISIDTPSLSVMTSVISEDVIAPILIIVCTLALLGYILFGSKGA